MARRPLGSDADEGIAAQAPDEETDLLDVVASAPLAEWANVDGPDDVIKRPTEPVERVDVRQVDGPDSIDAAGSERLQSAQMVQVLHPLELLEERDDARRPAGDVRGEVLEHRQRAFAPAVRDGVRYVCSPAAADAMERRGSDQIS